MKYHHLYNHKEGDEPACTHNYFFDSSFTKEEKCKIAMDDCYDLFDFINFYQITYCYFNGLWQAFLPLAFLIIYLIFKFISSVVEEYLAPSITYISEWLKLPEALAAVTLLALANGAGDVITAIVASDTPEGVSYNIGSIYGAGLFVASIVVAITIKSSGTQVQLEATLFWRDLGFYVLATIGIIVFGIIGKLTYISAIMMLALYIILVIVVSLTDNKNDQTNEEIKTILKSQILLFSDVKQPQSNRLKILTQNMKNLKNIVFFLQHLKQKKFLEQETHFSELSIPQKILYVIDRPFYYLKFITLPPCEKYNKLQATIYPIPFLLLMYFIIYRFDWSFYIFCWIFCGGICSVLIYLTGEAQPNYYIIIQVTGTIGALLWTYIVSGILVDLLQYLGMLSKLPSTYLALTVIAIGNALPDGVTTISLSKQGYAIMGLTGGYAGQLFGLLVGFGISLLKKTLQDGPQVFDLFRMDNLMNVMVIFVTLIVLVITIIYGTIKKYRLSSELANILIIVYSLFVITASIIAIKQALS